MSPSTYRTHTATEVRAVHDHPPIAVGDRACEPGIQARCGRCRQQVAPCTRSRVDVQAVKSGQFVCGACAGKGATS